MNKGLHFIFFIIISLNAIFSSNAQITLSHNIGDAPIQTDMFSCETSQSWSRLFKLSDFNITANDKFVIKSGQVALYNSIGGGTFQFNIYNADANFPETFSSADFIGSSQVINIPTIGEEPEVFDVVFDNPVIIPDGVENILIEVRLFFDINNPDQSLVYIAGTQEDNDVSYFSGCFVSFSPTETTKLETPVNNANFYINVTGDKFGVDDLGSQILLTHNECDDVVKVNQYGCSTGGLKFARVFNLEDFGVSNNEELVVDRGQVAIASVGVNGARVQFRIYAIDNNFPFSYSQDDLIGSSQIVRIPYFGAGNGVDPRLFEVFFNAPITIPENVDRVLVEVFNLGGELLFIAGGSSSNDDSWLRSESGGCTPFQEYITVTNPGNNFFVNVTGRTNHVTNNFEMNVSNICSEFLKEFSVENRDNIGSVIWDFGDTNSGLENSSVDLSPFHDFSEDGTYTISATITALDGNVTILSETIDVIEPPQAYGIDNSIACEDEFNSGISSSFDTSMIQQQVLGGQVSKIVTYFDGSGNEYDTLPNPFTNSIANRETIRVRVAHQDTPCCYSETSFDLIVNPIPNVEDIDDLVVCDSETNGFALFNLEPIKENIIASSTNITVAFYHENGQLINEPLSAIENLVADEEVIRVQAMNTINNCSNETTIKLKISPLPIANILSKLVGCDDNNDGISEYFDTSNIAVDILGEQTGMVVSYFDDNDNLLPNPLPNPYINTTTNQEIIRVRVTNSQTSCFAETSLVLNTASQPQINSPQPFYACDLGDGFASFDTGTFETAIIGNQNGLVVQYFDADGTALPSPLPNSFQNTEAWRQTIYVTVANELNSLCTNETSFDLVVNELPQVNIENSYFLCNLEPSLSVNIAAGFDSYNWKYQDESSISNTYEANLVNAGTYTLTVGKNTNGVYCENSFKFELVRSQPPTITEINFKELTANNFIEIIAEGDGDFEYSIDGVNYQNSNYFSNIQGGIYTVFVRDKDGCGQDSQELTLIDYPKFFTPNNDGFNDFWQIKGIRNFPNSKILLFDRYGKLLTQLSSNDIGWNGLYNGKKMMSNDYWFRADLGNGRFFSGHFSLKR